MAVYHHFGGIPELMSAVIDRGYQQLGEAFAQLTTTDDPIADLFAMALTTRRIASENPHLYDLMFGLSRRSTYRPTSDVRPSGRSPAFLEAYQHLVDACERLAVSGRVGPAPSATVAAALWSFVHGYITLELAEHFVEFHDPVREVLLPMGVTFSVGLGDTQSQAQASHEAAARRFSASPKRRPSAAKRSRSR
jgi:AcrR family transcriptional regulator